MFIALDESTAPPKKIFGGVLMPREILPEFEKRWVALRLQHNLFGELKWSKVTKDYADKYIDFLDLFFIGNKYKTYHSICFRDVKKLYNVAYTLLRTITYKINNAAIKRHLYIIFDKDTRGIQGIKNIREIAGKDNKFKTKIEFSCQADSHTLGVLQLADVISGALCHKINNLPTEPHQQKIIDFLEQKTGTPLDWSSQHLPALTQMKIHYFDPDDNPRRS